MHIWSAPIAEGGVECVAPFQLSRGSNAPLLRLGPLLVQARFVQVTLDLQAESNGLKIMYIYMAFSDNCFKGKDRN